MKRRLLFILCFIVGLGNVAFAQQRTRTVTNADLEKHRQARLAAERDLRENYEQLGFASPEVMEQRDAEHRAALERLAERLSEQQLERESLAMQQRMLDEAEGYYTGLPYPEDSPYRSGTIVYGASGFYYPGGYGYPGGYYNNRFPFYRPKVKARGSLNRRPLLRNRRFLNSRPIGGGYAFPNPFQRVPGVRVGPVRPR